MNDVTPDCATLVVIVGVLTFCAGLVGGYLFGVLVGFRTSNALYVKRAAKLQPTSRLVKGPR